MRNWRAWLTGIFLLLPALFLGAAGMMELRDGVAVDAAFPVPEFLSNNSMMPKAAYVDAAELLRDSNDRDGDAQISRAESMFYAGEQFNQVLPVLEGGLRGAPASSEGWAYYAAILANSHPGQAGRALDLAFTRAPYDYFLAGMRARVGAKIWPALNEETRGEVLRQARMLWEEPRLRDQLLPLLEISDGERLLTRAYGGSPETIRGINRWLRAERQKRPPQGS